MTLRPGRGAALSLAAASLALSPLAASAAGTDYPDNWARAMGMAGAHAGLPDDGSAVYYNPAALSVLKGVTLTLDSNFIDQSVRFQRTDAAGNPAIGGVPVNAIENSYGVFVAPMGAVTWQVRDGLTLAVGAYGPPAQGNYTYPDVVNLNPATPSNLAATAPQRYTLVERTIRIYYPGVAVGWRPLDWLMVGGNLQLAYGSFDFVQNIWASPPNATAPMSETPSVTSGPAFDVRAHVKTSSFKTITGVVGAAVQPLPSLTFGASWRPRFDFKSSGTIETQGLIFPITTLQQTGKNIDFTVPFPDVVRVGADWRPGPLHLALDLIYESWSRVTAFTIHPTETISFNLLGAPAGAIGDQFIQKQWKDNVGVRLGGEYALALQRGLALTPRAGVGYESSAIPDDRMSVDFPNWRRFATHVGATLAWRGYALTLAYAHVFQPDLNVRNSTVTANTAGSVGGQPVAIQGSVIGNGDYSGSYNMFSVGLSADFSRL